MHLPRGHSLEAFWNAWHYEAQDDKGRAATSTWTSGLQQMSRDALESFSRTSLTASSSMGSIGNTIIPSFRKKQVAKTIGLGQPRVRRASRRSLGLVKPKSRAQNARLAAHRRRWLASEPRPVHQHLRRSLNLIRSRLVRAPMQGLQARASFY